MPECYSMYGVLENKTLKTPALVHQTVCADRLFRCGDSDMMYSAQTSAGWDEIKQRDADKSDEYFFYARRHPNQSVAYLKEYLETFCYPLLSENKWNLVCIQPADIAEYKAMLVGKTMTRKSTSHGRVIDVETGEPWCKVSVKVDEVGGNMWYIVVCMFRQAYEQPGMIERLFEAKELGLTLSQCWVYSLLGMDTYYHHFLHLHGFNGAKREQLVDLDLVKKIERFLNNHDEPLIEGGKNTEINEEVVLHSIYHDDNYLNTSGRFSTRQDLIRVLKGD